VPKLDLLSEHRVSSSVICFAFLYTLGLPSSRTARWGLTACRQVNNVVQVGGRAPPPPLPHPLPDTALSRRRPLRVSSARAIAAVSAAWGPSRSTPPHASACSPKPTSDTVYGVKAYSCYTICNTNHGNTGSTAVRMRALGTVALSRLGSSLQPPPPPRNKKRPIPRKGDIDSSWQNKVPPECGSVTILPTEAQTAAVPQHKRPSPHSPRVSRRNPPESRFVRASGTTRRPGPAATAAHDVRTRQGGGKARRREAR
jgi:hypothetical protein